MKKFYRLKNITCECGAQYDDQDLQVPYTGSWMEEIQRVLGASTCLRCGRGLGNATYEMIVNSDAKPISFAGARKEQPCLITRHYTGIFYSLADKHYVGVTADGQQFSLQAEVGTGRKPYRPFSDPGNLYVVDPEVLAWDQSVVFRKCVRRSIYEATRKAA